MVAQQTTETSTNPQSMNGGQPLSAAAVDLTVPSAPAFSVLGVNPQNVMRPSTPRELATSFLSGVDANGNFQSGLALEMAPYMLFAGENVTLEKYRSNYLVRFLTNTGLSFATTKGSDDSDKSVRVAFGLRAILWQAEGGDARRSSFLDEAFKKLEFPPAEGSLEERTRRAAEPNEEQQRAWVTAWKSAKTQWEREHWNDTIWEVGLAPTWTSEEGDLSSARWSGAAFWTSFAYGFEGSTDIGLPFLEKYSQLILHARARTEERVPGPGTPPTFFEQDTALLGGRLRLGNERWALAMEGSYVHADRKDGQRNEDFGRLSIGAEVKVSDDLWLELAVGGDTGRDDNMEQTFVLGALSFGYSTRPTSLVSQQ